MFPLTVHVVAVGLLLQLVAISSVQYQTRRVSLDIPENVNNRNQLNSSIEYNMGMLMILAYMSMNMVSMPMVMKFALCKLLTVAAGPTRDTLLRRLTNHADSERAVKQTVQTCYSDVKEALDFLQEADLVLVNKMYLNYSGDIDPAFEANTESQGIHVDKVGFKNAKAASRYVNHWFQSATYQRVRNVLHEKEIDKNTSMVLLSAAQLKPSWDKPFDLRLTKEGPFYQMDNKTERVMMMTTITSGLYYKHAFFQILKIPLKSYSMSMTIVLPTHRHGFFEAFTSVIDLKLMREVNRNLTRTEVKLVLPRFKITSNVDWFPALEKMGLSTLYNASTAGLDKILRSHKDCKSVHLSLARQKVILEVDEMGVYRNYAEAHRNKDMVKIIQDAEDQEQREMPQRQWAPLQSPPQGGQLTEFLVDHAFIFFVDVQLSPFGDHDELLVGAYYGPKKTPELKNWTLS